MKKDRQEVESVGARMLRMRTEKRLTQKQLAEMAGISTGSLSRYENGTRTPMSDKAAALAGALDTTLDYLLTGEGKAVRANKAYKNVMQIIGMASQAQEITPHQANILAQMAWKVYGASR